MDKKSENAIGDFILGLDIGTNSIGWAVTSCDTKIEIVDGKQRRHYLPKTCEALNSRIFQEMVDAKSGKTKNEKRRNKRGARRNIHRLQSRRRDLEKLLVDAKLLPKYFNTEDETKANKILNEIDTSFAKRLLKKGESNEWSIEDRNHISPFAIRSYAAEGFDLEPYEFGRAIFHLQRRRGYLSNRDIRYRNLLEYLEIDPDKAIEDVEKEITGHDSDNKEEKEENKKVLQGLQMLKHNLDGQTLGQFVWKESQKQQQSPQRITRYGEMVFEKKKKKDSDNKSRVVETEIRKNFYAERSMYRDEFKKIWEEQKTNKHIKALLTEKLESDIFHAIFFQRPLQSQKSKVGKCSFMPTRKRTHKATLGFQEYRIRQTINHIRVKGEPLSPELREHLFNIANSDMDALNNDGRLLWKDVSKITNAKKDDINFKPGLDEAQDIAKYTDSFCKSGLVGNRTVKAICSTIGTEKWDAFSAEDKSQLVLDLIYFEDKVALYKRLCNHWKLPEGYGNEAYELAVLELPDNSYAKHCNYVINKLLKHLRDGMIYSEACESAGFYNNDDELSNQKLPLMPNAIENIANPRVQKALFEIRKVVNSVYKKYGAPSVIRVEMARDLKSAKKHRSEIEKQQGINRAINAKADREIRENVNSNDEYKNALTRHRSGKLYVNKNLRSKYKMWKFEQDSRCLYCGNMISDAEIFSGSAEIEHILPQTSFSDNYMNTVVACKSCNNDKGGRSPYEAWGSNEKKWNIIEINMEKFSRLPEAKKRRILKEDFKAEDVNDFSQRHLRETSYIAVACKNILEKSGIRVQISKGGATAQLRRYWGLDDLLPRHPEDEIDQAPKDPINKEVLAFSDDTAAKPTKPKNRKDHRHHAIDALVVSLTDHGTLQKLVKHHQHRQMNKINMKSKPLSLPGSWQENNLPYFIKQKLMSTVVSHTTNRKINGELHEETVFSKSHYVNKVALECDNKFIKKIQGYLENDETADGDISWIIGANIRNILQVWVKENLGKKPKDIKLPFNPSAKELKSIAVAHRCYVTTKTLKNISANNGKIEYTTGEWKPGKGNRTWIADRQVFLSLQKWQEENKDDLGEALENNPPRIISKNGAKGEIIKSVRLAEIMTADSIVSIRNGTKTFKAGSNHHVEIFRKTSQGADEIVAKKGRFVNMLDAATRASQRKPIIDTEPSPDWPGEWEFWMSLSKNDIIMLPEDNDFAIKHKHLGLPFYRVQSMTHSGKILVFKHHSISYDEKRNHGHMQKSVNVLPDNLKKIEIDPLGITA